jgi:hypothetical protein
VAAWILVPCLDQLRTELNRLAPNRDKSSDGTIGDPAHQSRVSDHNDDEVGRVPIKDADGKHEVHALDLDVNLNEPNLTMEMVVQHVVGRCRSGAEKRLRYVIYNRRIWEKSNGWRQRAYDGDNPHTGHAHFSASYETELEASTASWRLEDIPVALTTADKNWISAEVAKIVDARVDQLTQPTPLNGPDGQPDGTQSTPVGHNSWQQGVPNVFEGMRTSAWTLLGDVAEHVKTLTDALEGEQS